MLRSDRRCQTESERFSYLLRLFRDIKSNFLIKGQGAAHSEGSRGFVFARDNRDQVPGNLKTWTRKRWKDNFKTFSTQPRSSLYLIRKRRYEQKHLARAKRLCKCAAPCPLIKKFDFILKSPTRKFNSETLSWHCIYIIGLSIFGFGFSRLRASSMRTGGLNGFRESYARRQQPCGRAVRADS